MARCFCVVHWGKYSWKVQQYPEYFTAPGILFLEEGFWPSKVGWVNNLVRRLLKACALWDILLVVSLSGLLLLVSLAGSTSDILAATVLALGLLKLK